MKFGIIRPRTRTFTTTEAPNLQATYPAAGLRPMEVDHGVVSGQHSVVVYEFGLYDSRASLFSIGRQLLAGTAVVYQVDDLGMTVDFEMPTWRPVFYPTHDDAMAAIVMGRIDAPTIAINGRVQWRWPMPPSPDIARIIAQRGDRAD